MRSYKYYLPAALWAALLFLLSSLPSQSVPTLGIRYEDLFLHFIVYAVLGYFLGIAFMHSQDSIKWKTILIAALIGILYGASDEFHQKFVSGREAAVSDFWADSAGIIFGLTIFIKFPQLFKAIQKKFFL